MPKRSFYIQESELDEYQVKVIQRRTERPFIVKGCAGSGKSILALWKVKQIQEQELGSYYFILYTKTLRQYMQDGIREIGLKNDRVLHFEKWRWKWTYENEEFKRHSYAPSADYIVVDEAQDFSAEDIELFKQKAKKALILYGDSAQQIYGFKDPEPISMEQIAVNTGFKTMELMYNHRLPKEVARIAELISEDKEELEFLCKNEANELPKILEYNSLNEQLDVIIEIINNRSFEDIGILFKRNSEVEYAKNYFEKKGLKVEAKYNNSMDLDFTNDLPKLTTYHSSKGLQFEVVFLPNCYESDERNPLYVALTRTYQSLFILHSGNLSPFFDDIPNNLFNTSLVGKTSKRL